MVGDDRAIYELKIGSNRWTFNLNFKLPTIVLTMETRPSDRKLTLEEERYIVLGRLGFGSKPELSCIEPF